MRKTIYILLFLISYTAYSQSLSVFNVDASAFPTIKANFYALDATGNQLTNLNPSDFAITENGQSRSVTNISCPEPKPTIAVSSVLVMDVSASMYGNRLEIAKAAANVWVNMLPLGTSECAITSFSEDNYLNQDFTTDKTKLVNGINSLDCESTTDYNAALIDSMAGGILIAKKGKHKRLIVFLSDGRPKSGLKEVEIINEAIANKIAIYCVSINMPAPQCMKDFANQTGGLYFENIETKEEAEECYRKILTTAQVSNDSCEIEWRGAVSCVAGMIYVEAKITSLNSISNLSYKSPDNSIAKLEFVPTSVKFLNAIPGIKKDTTITVTARNADFNVTNITSSNPAYTVTPTSFFLINGQSQNLTVSYIPADSGYAYTKFTIENDKCPIYYYASGGFPGKKPKIQTLKLIQPNGGEFFAVGNDTIINWEGVLPQEKVKIEYSTDNGTNWILITNNAKGLSYKWRVPNTPSNQCLARVTSNLGYEFNCPDVKIGDQIWMGCNLDVDTYRDGTPIPEVTDHTEWSKLQTGAWCYYLNKSINGQVYGKLYNWYAVNDPRGLAPDGWHIPTDVEWTELSDCLGGEAIAGGKLKTTGTIESGDGLWHYSNKDATNESGFSALPGGSKDVISWFSNLGVFGIWWSSTENDTTSAWERYIWCGSSRFTRGRVEKGIGYSVRCVKD